MDDIADKIQELLSDEESMKQIKELADMFTASQQGETSGSTQGNGSMPDLSAFASMFSGMNNTANQAEGTAQDIGLGLDMASLMQIGQVISSANKSDKDTQLLLALRPHLKEEKQLKIDKAIKYLKLYAIYTALKESGVLKKFEKII